MKMKSMLATLIVALAAFSSTAVAGVNGAIWTTDSSCNGTDLNLYPHKADVYLNGGPHGKFGAMAAGAYWVQVTEPNGTLLGQSTAPAVIVGASGRFDTCYHLEDIVNSASSGLSTPGFDNTSNAGGEYKVWISTSGSFVNSTTKTDNFKAGPDPLPCDQSGCCDPGGCSPPPQADGFTSFVGYKFYDSNGNGAWDAGEPPVVGWPISFDGGAQTAVTDVTGRYEFFVISDGAVHTTNEGVPLGGFNSPGGSSLLSPWVNTNGASRSGQSLDIGVSGTVDLDGFGNMCIGGGNGHTIGFWSNKNGLTVLNSKSSNLSNLVALNLVNANGSSFDPATYAKYQSWLLSANATNMAYMLSAQMSAMYLSTQNSNSIYNVGVKGSAYIYSPGSVSANAGGFVTVDTLVNEANASAGANPLTITASAARNYQTALKNALDAGNNNANVFIQSSSCALPINWQQ